MTKKKIDVRDPAFDRLKGIGVDALEAERQSLLSEAEELVTRSEDTLSAEDEERFERLESDLAFIGHVQEQRTRLIELAQDPRNTERGSIGDDPKRGLTVRDNAMRVLERSVKDKTLPEDAAGTVEALLKSDDEQSFTARWAVATGSPEYRSAFAKMVQDPEHGHLLWTAAESDAFREVAAVQKLQNRGMLEGGPTTGGYMVPLSLDPAIMLTNGGSTNSLRQISRVVQTPTNSWTGITSAGVTAEWKAEAVEVADASPTLANPVIPVYKADAFVPFSFELEQDAVNLMSELQKLLIDGAEQLSNTAYSLGTGSGQPTGLITALTGTSSVVNSGGTEAFIAADLYSLQNALPPRFQANASWAASLGILNQARQFESGNGSLKFPSLQTVPATLLGRPVAEISNMDSTVNPAVGEDNYLVVYGDFSNFVIVDRIGTTLELVPHLVGANRRPTGERGALLWWRTGSDVVVDNAFRMLKVTTS